MLELLASVLPVAVAMALSPFPIIAVILIVLAPHRGRNLLAFLVGWFVTIFAIAIIVILAFGGGSDGGGSEKKGPVLAILVLVIGIAFIFAGGMRFGNRSKLEEPPKWYRALDRLSWWKAFLIGAALVPDPKNLPLEIAASGAISRSDIPVEEKAIVLVILVLVASSLVIAPVLALLLMGERAEKFLDNVMDWLIEKNRVVIGTVVSLTGCYFIVKAVIAIKDGAL